MGELPLLVMATEIVGDDDVVSGCLALYLWMLMAMCTFVHGDEAVEGWCGCNGGNKFQKVLIFENKHAIPFLYCLWGWRIRILGQKYSSSNILLAPQALNEHFKVFLDIFS